MGERNDLIERRWIGVVPSGLQGPAKVTRLERVAEIWRNQGLFVTEWVPATTIASLSEALAEAEKKGAEAERRLETVREAAFDEALKFIASRAHAALASRHRDISEGGQP